MKVCIDYMIYLYVFITFYLKNNIIAIIPTDLQYDRYSTNYYNKNKYWLLYKRNNIEDNRSLDKYIFYYV